MSPSLTVHDKNFVLYKSAEELQNIIKGIAAKINEEYAEKTPLFVPVLNGAFMFAADLLKNINVPCEVSFIKVASYQGTSSTGEVEEILGFDSDVAGRHIIIVEDIIDTGQTMSQLLHTIKEFGPASVSVCALLHKPEATKVQIPLKYVGIEVPNKFLLGYGLDYNEQGRNLPSLYVLAE